jgi:hypothetical protein
MSSRVKKQLLDAVTPNSVMPIYFTIITELGVTFLAYFIGNIAK